MYNDCNDVSITVCLNLTLTSSKYIYVLSTISAVELSRTLTSTSQGFMINYLCEAQTNLSCERSGSKYFGLCRPRGLCCCYSSLLHRQHGINMPGCVPGQLDGETLKFGFHTVFECQNFILLLRSPPKHLRMQTPLSAHGLSRNRWQVRCGLRAVVADPCCP